MRRLQDVVQILSQKLWCRFKVERSLWADSIRAKYCKRHCPARVKKYNNDSPTWGLLCDIRQIAEQNIFWVLGRGQLCFWHDVWLHNIPLATLVEGEHLSH